MPTHLPCPDLPPSWNIVPRCKCLICNGFSLDAVRHAPLWGDPLVRARAERLEILPLDSETALIPVAYEQVKKNRHGPADFPGSPICPPDSSRLRAKSGEARRARLVKPCFVTSASRNPQHLRACHVGKSSVRHVTSVIIQVFGLDCGAVQC